MILSAQDQSIYKAIKVNSVTKINFIPHTNVILVTLTPNLQNLQIVDNIGVMILGITLRCECSAFLSWTCCMHLFTLELPRSHKGLYQMPFGAFEQILLWGGAPLAQSEEDATLDLRVKSSSSTWGVEITKKI